MNDLAKVSLGFAAGATAMKVIPDKYWWLLVGAGALFLMNSPGTRSAITSGAKKTYAAGKAAVSEYRK